MGGTRWRRQAKPRRSALKLDRPHRSDSDRSFVLGFGSAAMSLAAWLSSLSCCFDDKAKPLREWRWCGSDYSETPPPLLRVFSFRLNRPNALLLAPRVRGARSHSRDTLHLYSACAVSKSARKPFVIKIKKQPAPGALKGEPGETIRQRIADAPKAVHSKC